MARSRGLRSAGAIALALAFVASACGSSDGKYVKNADLGIYLKVPHQWTTYTVEDGGPGLFDAGSLGTKVLKWAVAFDASQHPSRSNLDLAAPSNPVGTIEVFPSAALKVPDRTDA